MTHTITPPKRRLDARFIQKPKAVQFQGHQTLHENKRFSEEEARTLTRFLFQRDQAANGSLINHGEPRGIAPRIPGWSEALGRKISNLTVGLDFLPWRVSSAAHSGYNFIQRNVPGGSTLETQADQATENIHKQATQLTNTIAEQLDLSTIADVEQGLPEQEVKARIKNAFIQQPRLMYAANNALSHPVISLLKGPFVARADLKTLVEKLVFLESEPDEIEDSSVAPSSDQAGPSTETAARPTTLPHSQTIREKKLEKLEKVANDAQAAGALSARTTQGLANWMRTSPGFQIKNLTEDEATHQYFMKGKYPPLHNPHEFMAFRHQPSQIKVTDRFPTPEKSGIRGFLNSFWPARPQTVVDQKLPIGVASPDPNAQLLIGALIKGKEDQLKDFKIQPGTVVSVKLRDNKKFKKEVFQPIVNTFRITEPIEIKDGDKLRKVEIKEACLWPFIEAVITRGEKGLGPKCFVKGTEDKKCFDLLADSEIYQFDSTNPELKKFLNDQLHRNPDPKIRDLKARLAAIQIAGLQYAEQVDVAETVASFLKGTAIGVAGEKLADKIGGGTPPGQNVFQDPGFWIRVAFLGMIDSIDNWFGEHCVLEADLKGMGLGNNKRHVFGEAPPDNPVQWKDYLNVRKATNLPEGVENLRRRLLLLAAGDADGKAAQSVASIYRAIALGGVGGVGASLYAAKTFTETDSAMAERIVSTSIGTLGALSIPINFSLILPRVMSALNEHLEEGRLLLPDNVDKDDPKQVKAYILEMALQDMMSRTGLQASTKAYTVIPLLGLGWLSELAIPRSIVQTGMFSLMPVSENITRGGLMLDRVNRTFPKSMANLEGTVLAAHMNNEENLDRYQQNIRREFNGSWSKTASQMMNYVTYLLQAAMTNRRHIDYHDGPEAQTVKTPKPDGKPADKNRPLPDKKGQEIEITPLETA